MPFPDSKRVIYEKNPLEQVICQLRFPPVLKIETDLPASFQDAIRREYPLFEERQDGPDFPREISQQLSRELARFLSKNAPSRKTYSFTSLDRNWTVTLERDSFALTANRYETWEEFIEHFKIPYESLLKEYTPALFSRVGLRYQNVIQPSRLGIINVDWSELLQPHIAGILGDHDVGKSVSNTTQTVEIKLQNSYGTVKIRHGLVKQVSTEEDCYLIDSDFAIESIKESENVLERLGKYNRRAGRLFRWCIKPKLHTAMEPRDIE